jgi:acetyltransferase-like isoleucine patch superfamily enzyme
MTLDDIEALVGEDPEVNPAAVRAIVTEDRPDGPQTLVVLAEFGGPRVSCVGRLTARIRDLLTARAAWKGDVVVEVVRDGWLAGEDGTCAPAAECAQRYERLRTRRRDTVAIANETFGPNITEAEQDAFAYFGSFSKIRTPTWVAHPRLIHIGNWVSFGRLGKIFMQTDFSAGREYLAQHYPDIPHDVPDHLWEPRTPRLEVGDGTTIGDFFFINCNADIEIGRHVGIADRCYIADANHLHGHPDLPSALMPNDLGSPIRIGDHGWLGINAVVLNGARIGKHCIVSSNSVVTSDMPDYTLAVGNPARVVPFAAFGFNRK